MARYARSESVPVERRRSFSEDAPLKERVYSTWYRIRYGERGLRLSHTLREGTGGPFNDVLSSLCAQGGCFARVWTSEEAQCGS